jgi:hypothetical protein
MIYKSQLIVLSTVVALGISGCNDTMTYDENIEGIRNAVMEQYSEALTVGQALDGWQECKNSEWVSKTGDRGENLVIFKCELINQKYYTDSRINKAQYALLFSSSVDGLKFKPESDALIFTFDDEKIFTYERDEMQNLLTQKMAYGTVYGDSVIDNLIRIYANKEVFIEINNEDGFYEKRE